FKRGETSFEGLREKFFWYATSYSEFGELTEEFVRVAADESHSAPRVPSSDSERKILRTHGLSKNPLEFFKELTFWRDERKRLNYTGLYGLLKILREVFRRQAIELALVNSLAPWEAIDVFEKDIPVAELETRMHEGFFLHITEEGKIEFAVGEEGKQYWAQVATRLSQSTSGEIKGTVASRGMARGIVHVIYDFADPKAVHFKSGDILVTAMTRPEFMPLIRKAAAIVTDEGGITSHAAIVSRELGKPCIIGTRNASQLLKDGDMVEVDAEKGIVRKLEK
ncbi:MAG TPA: PEP-utilizing enzyme, partial [Candidatus Paceibacterota bacterium]|nr:PEP-utilizing enzyme [Candidatus Paceibacterota bacterium]